MYLVRLGTVLEIRSDADLTTLLLLATCVALMSAVTALLLQTKFAFEGVCSNMKQNHGLSNGAGFNFGGLDSPLTMPDTRDV